jgi:hypothetical protein
VDFGDHTRSILVGMCRAFQREAAHTRGHDKSNEISGHANGEKQPSRRIARPKRSGEPSVHGDANARQGERSGQQ